MRSPLSFLLAGVFLVALIVPSTAVAQDREFEAPRWSVSVEGRVTNDPDFAVDDTIDLGGLLPNFSLYLGDKWRFDASASAGDAPSYGFHVNLTPGFRRYVYNSHTGRFRVGTGAALGFQLFNRPERFELRGFDPEGNPQIGSLGKELFTARVVPIEMEYWLNHRSALTFGADLKGSLYDGGTFDYEGEGVFGGFRLRIK